jgi:hypothetical protein
MFYWRIDLKNLSCKGVLVVLTFLLFCCGSNTESRTSLYRIDSLVTSQVKYLTEIKARLHKEATLKNGVDSVTYLPKDTAAWINELDIFLQLNAINKPINRDSYLVDDGLMDPTSNLTVKAFTSTKDLPVVYLRIFYQDNIRKPRKIEALYDEANSLYQSARLLTMDFQQIDNKTVLTSYSIKGGQKMIMGDSVNFFVRGKILMD